MSRAFIVWSSCIILALLGVTGAHGHRTVAHTDASAHDAANSHASISESASLMLAGDSSAHERGHTEQGHVDVDPPVKVFSKTPISFSLDLVFLLWVGVIVSILRLASSWAPLGPIDRPPKKRWHPFQLPPAQAPPRTA